MSPTLKLAESSTIRWWSRTVARGRYGACRSPSLCAICSVVAPENADSKSSKSESPARGDDSNESTSVEELKGGASFSFDDLEAAQ